MEKNYEEIIKKLAANVERLTGKGPTFTHSSEFDRRIIVSMDFEIARR